MNQAVFEFWTERARQAQSRIRRKPRRARHIKRDLVPFKRKLGMRLTHQLDVEDAHIMDIEGCTAGDWGGIPNM